MEFDVNIFRELFCYVSFEEFEAREASIISIRVLKNVKTNQNKSKCENESIAITYLACNNRFERKIMFLRGLVSASKRHYILSTSYLFDYDMK